MKKTVIFALMILVCTLFLGCPLNPRTMVPKSSEQICSYMTEKFGGTFEVISNQTTNNDTQKLNKVLMSCSQLPGKTIITTHGFEETIFGWQETFTTNYNRLYYKSAIEAAYDDLIDDWFGDFEYKAVFANPNTAESVVKYSSFQEYLDGTISFIVYKVVIKVPDASTKNAAIIKAHSVAYDISNETDYQISLDLYLWENETSYLALDDDDIAELERSHEYIYDDVTLWN